MYLCRSVVLTSRPHIPHPRWLTRTRTRTRTLGLYDGRPHRLVAPSGGIDALDDSTPRHHVWVDRRLLPRGRRGVVLHLGHCGDMDHHVRERGRVAGDGRSRGGEHEHFGRVHGGPTGH